MLFCVCFWRFCHIDLRLLSLWGISEGALFGFFISNLNGMLSFLFPNPVRFLGILGLLYLNWFVIIVGGPWISLRTVILDIVKAVHISKSTLPPLKFLTRFSILWIQFALILLGIHIRRDDTLPPSRFSSHALIRLVRSELLMWLSFSHII
jgi:hypothetical protein